MKKLSKKSILRSVVTVGAITATGTIATTAHADTQPTNQSSATRSAIVMSAQDQLNNLKQQQLQAESNLAKQNNADYAKSKNVIQPQINDLNAQLKKQKADQEAQDIQITQKFYQTKSNAANKQENQRYDNVVSAENTSYNQSVSIQTTANQASEDALAKQNDQALQEASKHVVTPAQKDALTKSATDQFNAGKQAAEQQFTDATNKANDDHQTKLNELNTDKQNDVNNAQAKHEQAIATQQQANDQAIANAQHAYDNAVANAPKISDATKPAQPATSVNDLTDAHWADPEGLNDETKPYYPIVHVARWNNIENSWFKNPQAMKVSNKDQLPMDFKPGIILYDATNDHSAKIASTGLTEDQKRELNTLSNHWLNQVRHYFWDVLQIQKTNPNAKISGYYNGTRELTVKDFAPQAPIHDLFTPNEYWQQVGQVISHGREKYGTDYEHTTPQASNKFTPKDHNRTGWNDGTSGYNDLINLWGLWTTQHNDNAEYDPSLQDSNNESLFNQLASGENLYKINGSTMLEMEVSLYNKLQEMTYGEYQGQISNTNKTPLIGGHLANVLNPKFQFVTMAFQNATTDPSFKASPNTGSNYYVMWDFAGIQNESVSENALKKSTAEGGKWVGISKTDTSIDAIVSPAYDENVPGHDLIDPNGEINTGIVDQIHAAQTDSNAKPNLNDPSVVSAKQNLDHVKSEAETKLNNVKNANSLDQINADYAAKINAENDRYNDQIKQIKDQRDQNLAKLNEAYSNKIAQIKALPESTDQLKAQLDQKMTDLKNANAKKLADLKKEHEDKLQALAEEHQAKLNDIKADLNKQVTGYKQQLADKHSKDNQGLVDQINALQSKLTSQKAKLDKQLVDLKAQHQTEYNAMAAKLAPKQVALKVVNGNTNHYEISNGNTNHYEISNDKTIVLNPQKSSNVKHVTKETKQNKSTLMTREEYKRLPQTGSDNSLALVALGALSSMFGLGLASFNRKKVL